MKRAFRAVGVVPESYPTTPLPPVTPSRPTQAITPTIKLPPSWTPTPAVTTAYLTETHKFKLLQDSMVTITIKSVNPDAECDGSFGLYSPSQNEHWSDYRISVGDSKQIGSFSAGTELIFYLEPRDYCDNIYLSTGDHAIVTPLGTNSWEIAWEDHTDSSYNDLVVDITIKPR